VGRGFNRQDAKNAKRGRGFNRQDAKNAKGGEKGDTFGCDMT
jgi:hypothetical protein